MIKSLYIKTLCAVWKFTNYRIDIMFLLHDSYSITLCITVFGVLWAWGGIGLELQPLVKIKTARPAAKLRLAQKSKKQENPNTTSRFCKCNAAKSLRLPRRHLCQEKKTHQMVRFLFTTIALVGMPSSVQSPRLSMVSDSWFDRPHHTTHRMAIYQVIFELYMKILFVCRWDVVVVR